AVHVLQALDSIPEKIR
ncbi:MAG: DUF6307 family protein, partial [Mycobacterium sp.]